MASTSTSSVIRLSTYAEKLPLEAKQRYLQKITTVGSVDPFLLQGTSLQQAPLPAVDASDLVSYLVLQTSYITTKQFKAHKSLEAYNQFANGWVKQVESWTVEHKVVVTGRVRHSQRCNATPLSCWIIAETSGEIICAHCNCMAGLGEVCTHVAAVLFYVETAVKLNGTTTCTQLKCSWVVPSYQADIPYVPIGELDFTSAKTKMKELKGSELSATSTSSLQLSKITAPSDQELDRFYDKLSQTSTKPAILSLVPAHAHKYIPTSKLPNYPKPLQSLYEPSYTSLSYADLLAVCKEVQLSLTTEMVAAVEMSTRQQGKSKLWFKYRAGRVTASKMKAVCHTQLTSPSQSLIKAICYPEAFKFVARSTSWGCDHEKTALQHYEHVAMEKHDDLRLTKCGLILNPLWPFLGASPDGTVCCACCGSGVVEIKCPYCSRFEEVSSIASERTSCLLYNSQGDLCLDHTHAYYYQVQTQLYISGAEYCDFCVCTFPTGTSGQPSLHIERVLPDEAFWIDCVKKSETFFTSCILPELLGKWYSKPLVPVSAATTPPPSTQQRDSNSGSSDPLYCYCRQPEDITRNDWIGCDNANCVIEWFHLGCLNLTTPPKTKLWYCPDCRKLPEFACTAKRKCTQDQRHF